MLVLKRQYHLQYSGRESGESRSPILRFCSNSQSLIKNWSSSTRVSPVWKVKPDVVPGAGSQNKRPKSVRTIWFISNSTPAFIRENLSNDQLGTFGDDSLWLSLGFYSLIIVSRSEEMDEQLEEVLTKNKREWERWGVKKVIENGTGFEIKDTEFSRYQELEGKERPSFHTFQAYKKSKKNEDDTIESMRMELYALLSVIESRSKGAFKVLFDDCLGIENLATRLVSGEILGRIDQQENGISAEADDDPNSISTALLTLNAGLSRLASQAFSGVSPIMHTECHFWPNSFLGTGVANLALRNLSNFITESVKASKFSQRYELVTRKNYNELCKEMEFKRTGFPSHFSLDAIKIIDADLLSSVSETEIDAEEAQANETRSRKYEILNPITYFSGRDGFSNKALTTSAPLSTISGANSYKWNLGTITHELSHRVLSGKIQSILLSMISDLELFQEEGKKIKNYTDEKPKNIYELVKRLFCFTLTALRYMDIDNSEVEAEMSRPYDFMQEAKDVYDDEIEEILVHVFDYIHFYESDPLSYCNFIWQSWAVQPSIFKKLDDYINRTLCALAARHLGSDDWFDQAVAEFISILRIEPLNSNLVLKDRVLALLQNDEYLDQCRVYLDAIRHILIAFYLVFKCSPLEEMASYEINSNRRISYRKSRGKEDEKRVFRYDITQKVFASENPGRARPRFSNPLQFVRDFSREESPDPSYTAWLLHMMAFNVSLGTSKK